MEYDKGMKEPAAASQPQATRQNNRQRASKQANNTRERKRERAPWRVCFCLSCIVPIRCLLCWVAPVALSLAPCSAPLFSSCSSCCSLGARSRVFIYKLILKGGSRFPLPLASSSTKCCARLLLPCGIVVVVVVVVVAAPPLPYKSNPLFSSPLSPSGLLSPLLRVCMNACNGQIASPPPPPTQRCVQRGAGIHTRTHPPTPPLPRCCLYGDRL